MVHDNDRTSLALRRVERLLRLHPHLIDWVEEMVDYVESQPWIQRWRQQTPQR